MQAGEPSLPLPCPRRPSDVPFSVCSPLPSSPPPTYVNVGLKVTWVFVCKDAGVHTLLCLGWWICPVNGHILTPSRLAKPFPALHPCAAQLIHRAPLCDPALLCHSPPAHGHFQLSRKANGCPNLLRPHSTNHRPRQPRSTPTTTGERGGVWGIRDIRMGGNG